MDNNIKSQTIIGVIWSFIERFSIQGVQFVLGIIMARLLSPSDYGLIGIVFVFISISQVFIDAGFTNALIQKQNRSEADFSTVFYINLVISTLFYILLFFIAPIIASFYKNTLLIPIIRVYSISLILNSLIAIHRTKLVIAVDFKTQTKISFTASAISGIIGVSCAYLGCGVWALVIQTLVLAILSIILYNCYVRWRPILIFSKESFHNLFAFGSKLLVASLISTIYNNLYIFIIGKKYSTYSLGLYTRADNFSQFVSANISNILTRVSFPILTQIQNDDMRLVRAYSKYIKMSVLIVFPLILGLCGISKPLILFLLSEKWADCIILLQILCFSYLWNCVISVNLNLLYVKGRSDLVLKLEFIKKTIAFIILFVSLYFDLIGMCLGLVLNALIAFYLNTYYTKKILNYGFGEQMKEIAPYLILSLFIMAEALLISSYIDNSLLSITISLLVCTISYVSICYLFKLDAAMELIDILKKRDL